MGVSDRPRRARLRLNPDGNERLTAAVGALLLVPIAVELLSVLLGVHAFMSLHVFVGLLLIPPVLLKLASTGWRFARYYLGSDDYVVHGPPQLAMRLLAPLLVAATLILLGSGIAMGVLHGHALAVARRLHGPTSVVWMVLVGLHVLVYLKRSLIKGTEDVAAATRASVQGARGRAYLVLAAVAAGFAVAAATVPAQHRWVNLRRDHRSSESLPRRLDCLIGPSSPPGSLTRCTRLRGAPDRGSRSFVPVVPAGWRATTG